MQNTISKNGFYRHGSVFIEGGINLWASEFIGDLLTGIGGGSLGLAQEALALTTDSTGGVYVANATGLVTGPQLQLQLNFGPEGIAVDSARGRIYLSNQSGNQILVYNTTGTLLHTIE